jgi:hypothetical protein
MIRAADKMQIISSLAFGLALVISAVDSAPHPSNLVKRCTNSASDRSCWSDLFDLSSNYYTDAPDTGATVEVCVIDFLDYMASNDWSRSTWNWSTPLLR